MYFERRRNKREEESRRVKMSTISGSQTTSVKEFYRDRSIFVTGVTGFMGKVLVEKLLRSCPIKNIYVLIRNKKGQDAHQRLRALLNGPVCSTALFSPLIKVFPIFETRENSDFIVFFFFILHRIFSLFS